MQGLNEVQNSTQNCQENHSFNDKSEMTLNTKMEFKIIIKRTQPKKKVALIKSSAKCCSPQPKDQKSNMIPTFKT